MEFMKESNLESMLKFKPDVPKGDVSDPLFGKEVVMTGFRDKELMKELEARGAKQGSSVKTDTVALLVKDLDEDTSKVEQARKKNVPIMTVNMFRKEYKL